MRSNHRAPRKPDGFPDRTSVRGGDRLAVLELDLVHVPGTAWRAAAQRLDRELELIARLERLRGPAVACQRARAATLEVPRLGLAVLVLDLEDDERMRARILEFLDHAGHLRRMLLIEHREGVVGDRHAGEGNERGAG